MKKEKMLKVMLVLVMGVILFVMSTNVYAVEDDIYLDIQDSLPTDNTNTNTGTTTNTNTGTTNTNLSGTTNTNLSGTNSNADYSTNLPEAGLAENTLLGVGVTVLVIVAIVAYKKVNEELISLYWDFGKYISEK